MMDDEGHPLTDSELLNRVQEMGALVIRRGPVESLDFTTWRSQLRAEAKARGFRIHTHRTGDGAVLVSNPDHVVDPQRLRAAVNAISIESDPGSTDRHSSQ
ncbi:hypothetical protein [Rhodococcus sp. 1168]|uniref:hypothetical protein n=1 Tax=Rhodococcus sp. 1168 TaxID=2018041 RepID=UPI000A0CA4F1|nr:hypothetical protein [Rhodococcus sp. 1168]ORI13561.1 hypothetical protein BJI47_23370 [Rhodococcus sp. 1168]